MPANYLVINSKFKPFSYAEMLQPVAQATQAHQELENQYAELATKANVWENMANEQTDPYAYKMYKTYANDLENQAGQLAREGLTPASRQNMLNMRERYSSDIVPIEQAYQRRKELVDEQRKLLAQDNTLLFSKDASTLSLDDLIRNPQLSYQSYSGAILAKQVGTAAQNLAKEMRNNPREWRSILGNSYYETLMQKGFRPEEILKAVQGDSDASPILTKLVEDTINSSRIVDWGNEDTLNRAYSYAREGLWNAVGETQYQNLDNWRAKMNLQDYYARKLKGLTGPPEDNSLYYRAVPHTSVDNTKKTTEMSNDLKIVQELLKDPSLIGKKSKRTIFDTMMISGDPQSSFMVDTGVSTGNSVEKEYNPYEEALKNLSSKYNIEFNIKDGVLDTSSLEELNSRLINDIKSSAVRDFTYKPNITQSDLIGQVIKENARSNDTRSGKTGLYELKDGKVKNQIDANDLNKYFTSDIDFEYDVDKGFIMNSTDKDGKKRSLLIDTELYDDPDRTLKRTEDSIRTLLKYGETESASSMIDSYMQVLYDKFNTLVKRQSNTNSNI